MNSINTAALCPISRSDGFPPPTWMKRERSKASLALRRSQFPFVSGTNFYLLSSEEMTHSLQEKKEQHAFCWKLLFLQEFLLWFLISLLPALYYASAFVFLQGVLFKFFTRKEKTALLCVRLRVLSREFAITRTQQELIVDSFILQKEKRSPLLQVCAR